LDGGVLVGWILKLYYCEGQTIYENHDIRSPVLLAFDDGELVYGQKLVVLRILEVHQAGVVPGYGAVFALVFYGYAVDEHFMKSPVVGQERWRMRAENFAEGFVQGIRWHRGIEAAQGVL